MGFIAPKSDLAKAAPSGGGFIAPKADLVTSATKTMTQKIADVAPKVGQVVGKTFGPIGEIIGRGAGEFIKKNPETALDLTPSVAGAVASLAGGLPAMATAMTARAALEIRDKATPEDVANRLKQSVVGRGPVTAMKEIAINNPMSMAKIAGEGIFQISAQVPAFVKKAIADKSGFFSAKALGATKAYLNSDKKIKEANAVGRTMLEEGVVTKSATPEKMAESVENLIQTNGQKIGQYLESVGAKFNLTKVVDDLESIRPKSASGKLLADGKWKAINTQIDEAVATVKSFGEDLVDFTDANRLKGVFQESTNWYGKTTADAADRVISGRVRSLIDESLDEMAKATGKGKEYSDFLRSKKVYGHAQKAKDFVYNRLSSDLGNKSISLTDWIAAVGVLSHGNPVAGGAMLATKKLSERYGAQMLATTSEKTVLPLAARVGLIPTEGYLSRKE